MISHQYDLIEWEENPLKNVYDLVYKLLGLGWQIANKLSGLNLFSLCSNQNYNYRKVEFPLCNKHKIAVKWALHKNPAISKALLGKS